MPKSKPRKPINDTTATMQAAAQPTNKPQARYGLATSFERIDDTKAKVTFAWLDGKRIRNPETGKSMPAPGSVQRNESLTLDFSKVPMKTLQYISCTNGVVVRLQALLRRKQLDQYINDGAVDVSAIMPGEGERQRGSGGGFARKDFVAELNAQIKRMADDFGHELPAPVRRKMLADAQARQAQYDANRAKALAASRPTNAANVVPMPAQQTAAKACPRKGGKRH